MKNQKVPYKRILFVCCNSRQEGVCCSPPGAPAGEEIRSWLKEYVKRKGLKGRIRISKSGCMDLCNQGPNLMVFPENIWIKGVHKDDLPQLAALYIETAVSPSA